MMIESMAGKAAAMHGFSGEDSTNIYDATPFVFNEDQTAINHFGDNFLLIYLECSQISND